MHKQNPKTQNYNSIKFQMSYDSITKIKRNGVKNLNPFTLIYLGTLSIFNWKQENHIREKLKLLTKYWMGINHNK